MLARDAQMTGSINYPTLDGVGFTPLATTMQRQWDVCAVEGAKGFAPILFQALLKNEGPRKQGQKNDVHAAQWKDTSFAT